MNWYYNQNERCYFAMIESHVVGFLWDDGQWFARKLEDRDWKNGEGNLDSDDMNKKIIEDFICN